ncbi:adhesion G protein-coupled receptor F4-like isoform X2 [Chanodichthys erythropterus]|uniref:adhesion G protein-coupled receptor F4-like isoform X2 n=1 Tax=Chanodichthys erythropterus TaxID=933992 RepID=UPI00351F2AD1
MASKDAWTALKYLLGLHIAILLTHFSYKDGPLDHWIRQKSTGFDTEDGMPGNGQKCEEMDRPCEKYNEGRLSYQYRSGDWKPILDDCVLQVIKDLERRAKASVEQDIPVFVAQLSNATVQHNQEITQSPVTVRTIVGILVHITDISQNITINKPVMENFLKTVDILVSDKSRETWRKLNTGNTTSNTSTELLSAIEDISSRLTDDSFTINETSIELIRTVIENSYRANSKLPNSTTKILIPQVHKPTSLTIIVFTTLYNVLPTRDTRNNNSRKSDVQINGDVVVIKVNETLNNISFTFDMTDPSLGNAQCVFWNFNHETWDSTGCEVKPYISEGNETGKIICECNHTTSFSILMSPFFIDDKALDYITFAGLGISVASLILLLIIYRRIGWRFNVCLVNIAVCLIIANISFIVGATIVQPGEPSPVVPCSVVAFFMHVFYLAYFFWMLFSALDLHMIIFNIFTSRPLMLRPKMMALVSYGVPLLIVVITLAGAGAGKYILESDVCWLNWDETKAMQIFVSLALIIVAFDILILLKFLRYMWGHWRGYPDSNRLWVISRTTISYTSLFGLTWVFGIGTMLSPSYGIHLVFTVLNSLQGFFILVMKLLTVPKVRETLSNVFRMLRKRENNIPEVIIPEDNKRAPEQISLPVIQVSNQNVHLNDNDEHADVNDSTGHHEAHSNTESHDLPESDCLLPPNTDSHKDDSKNVHLNDNDEHGDVNDSTGHHEVNSDSESRDLSESDCLLPPNTDSHKDVDSSGLQDEIEQNELVVPTAQNQQEVPLSDCSNMRSALMDPSSSQCMHSVPRALWDVKYVCCDGGKLLARVLNVEKRTTMSMKSLALLMHLLF